MENEIVVFASDDIGRSLGLKVNSCGTLMYLLFQNTRDPIYITLLHYNYSCHTLLL